MAQPSRRGGIQMNVHVAAPVSGGENVCLGGKPIDTAELHMMTFKILRAFELIGTLVQTEFKKANRAEVANHEHEAFLNNVELIASTFADISSRLLDNLPSVPDTDVEANRSIYENRGFPDM